MLKAKSFKVLTWLSYKFSSCATVVNAILIESSLESCIKFWEGEGPPRRFLDVVGVDSSWADWVPIEDGVDGFECWEAGVWSWDGDLLGVWTGIGDESELELEGWELRSGSVGDIITSRDILKLVMYLWSRFPAKKSFGNRMARSSLDNSRKSSPSIPCSTKFYHAYIWWLYIYSFIIPWKVDAISWE